MADVSRDVAVERDVAVPMRDGAVLRADVYRPGDERPAPALVHRTPYGKQTAAMVADLVADPEDLARHGYAVVVQDVRGRFASEGDWAPVTHERDDGFDTVEWAAAQPWCIGRVGAYGSSYMGIATYQALAAQPPHLAAAATIVSGCDLNDGLARTGGVLELGFMALWAVSGAADTVARTSDPVERARLTALLQQAAADPWAVVHALPAAVLPVEVAPWLADWIAREPTDLSWQTTTLTARDVHVPLLQIVGFRDWMQRSMVRLFRELPLDDRSRLVAGPWTHRSAYGGDSGGRDWSAAAPAGPTGHLPRLLTWFDRWLRDRPDDAPRVSWFVTGDERWQAGEQWPPPGRELRWHTGPDGRLVDRPVTSGSADEWRHDPADPVPTCGGMIAMPLFGPDGVQDRAAVEARPDVLTYTTDPLDRPLTVTGDVRLGATIEADAADVDLVAFLVDVLLDETAEPVTEGIARARYRGGDSAIFLKPGEPAALTVHLADTAHTFLPGHRIRLEVAASNFPRFARNSGTCERPEHAHELRPVRLRLHHGAELILNVVPSGMVSEAQALAAHNTGRDRPL